MDDNLATKALAVIQAARAWRRKDTGMEAPMLMRAVDALEVALPQARFARELPWAEVPVGWFVLSPRKRWYEVAGSSTRDGEQWISLRIDGQTAEFPRDPAMRVICRPPDPVDSAVATLREVFTVTVLDDDAPPWEVS